jgi:hypothetical protein
MIIMTGKVKRRGRKKRHTQTAFTAKLVVPHLSHPKPMAFSISIVSTSRLKTPPPNGQPSCCKKENEKDAKLGVDKRM